VQRVVVKEAPSLFQPAIGQTDSAVATVPQSANS
jgi:hypothetical protein